MAKKNFEKTIVVLLCIGALVLRLVAGYRQYAGDVNNHIGWAQSLDNVGFYGFYEREVEKVSKPNYPSLAMYGFWFAYKLYLGADDLIRELNDKVGLFPSTLVWWIEQKNTMALFLKLPSLIGDGLVAVVVYLLAVENKRRRAWIWPMAVLYNPALFYASAVWGQTESLVMGLVLMAMYMGIKGRVATSVAIFGIAALNKQTALWLAPALLMFWSREKLRFVWGVVVAAMISYLSFIPFLGWSWDFVLVYLRTLEGSSFLASDKAFNLWFFLFGMSDDRLEIMGTSLRVWSILMLVMVAVATTIWTLRSKKPGTVWVGAWLMAVASFFLQTRVHERHLYPAVVLSLGLMGRHMWVMYMLLSIYFMVNLYWSLGLPFF